jgi:hypothetical protein
LDFFPFLSRVFFGINNFGLYVSVHSPTSPPSCLACSRPHAGSPKRWQEGRAVAQPSAQVLVRSRDNAAEDLRPVLLSIFIFILFSHEEEGR